MLKLVFYAHLKPMEYDFRNGRVNMSQSGKMNWILIAVLLAVIFGLLVTLLLVMDHGQGPAQPQSSSGTESTPDVQTGIGDQLEIQRIEEQGDVVVVTTNYCRVTYPYAFSDLVQVEQINSDEKVALRFYAVVSGKRMELYELVFGGEGSAPLGMLILNGKALPLTANFYKPAADISENDRIAFVAAQETFNDVALSLEDNAHFTPAE